ncbi:MAG: sulfur carrier protein ThiS [Epsilonproteobacteria bacterium]|nr:sulfur carrier protein ThiS [Campylobacterota bacterium]
MKLLVNDKTVKLDIRTVAELISNLKLNERMLYIQVNEQTIKKEEYATKMLKENDHIDIISAVGGGQC